MRCTRLLVRVWQHTLKRAPRDNTATLLYWQPADFYGERVASTSFPDRCHTFANRRSTYIRYDHKRISYLYNGSAYRARSPMGYYFKLGSFVTRQIR